MLKHQQLRFGAILGAFLLVIALIGAYTLGTLSQGEALAAQAATPTADPHAGHHANQEAEPTVDPHAGHSTTESEPSLEEVETPAAFDELVEEWETMQEHRGHGMVHPTDEHIEHMTSMLMRLRQVMVDASPAEHAAMHERAMSMLQQMMPMYAEIMDEIAAMPAAERADPMSAALSMFEEMTGLMAMMSSHSEHEAHGSADSAASLMASIPLSGTSPLSGTVPMRMQGMGMMGMKGDMQGMMGRMQGMMEDMHGSMPMDDMQGMMGRMDNMMKMMGDIGMMGGMDRGDSTSADPHAGHSAADAEATPTAGADKHAAHHPATVAQATPTADPHAGHGAANAPAKPTTDPHAGHGASAQTSADDHGAHVGHGGPIPSENVPDAVESIGGQPLDFTEEDGVKVFELTAQPVRWTILEGDEPVTVTAWSYNGTVPGPMIRVTEGEQVRIVLTNNLPEATSIHWHGMPVPYEMDGMTPVAPGESFMYEFTAPAAGSYMYHSHVSSDVQVMVGLYAPFIVEPAEPEENAPAVDVMWLLSEWRVVDGQTYPAMPMTGGDPNYFTINGKAYPSTEKIEVKKGDTVRIRIAAIGQFAHPMHLHGMNFRIVGYDGISLRPEQQIVRNTVTVNPGEIVDIEFTADNVGSWMFHCHILHHVTNDGVEPGGLLAIVEVIE